MSLESVVIVSKCYFRELVICTDVKAKTSRPRPELRGRNRGRGQFLEVEAKAEAKNNDGKVPNND